MMSGKFQDHFLEIIVLQTILQTEQVAFVVKFLLCHSEQSRKIFDDRHH
jgi:hypothetical protein